MSGSYPAFLAVIASWFGAWGMQHVLFAWLVAGELHEDPRWVGTAQMCVTLPALVLLFAGGAAADRADRRRLLALLHVLGALASFALAGVVQAGELRLGILFVYAFAWGSFNSFVLPSRDSLLTDVAGADLARAVTGVTLAQFIAQALGSRVAGLAAELGSPALLCGQGLWLLLGLLGLTQLRVAHAPAQAALPGGDAPARSAFHEAVLGLREVVRSPRLRVVALLVVANGLFFMGPYFVLCPLLVRDVYHGDVSHLSNVMLAFPLGTILGSLWMLWRGGIARKGRALMLGLAGGGACLATLALPLPFSGFLAAIFGWGLCGAVFLNMSRTLFQEGAPDGVRARVLAVYSLAMIGIAPASALASGFLAEAVGSSAACAGAGLGMIATVALVWVTSEARGFE
jgi:MFS family permease